MKNTDTLAVFPLESLTQEQRIAVAAIVAGNGNVFLTGPALSGKTTVLNTARSLLEKEGKTVLACAFSGLSARRIGGETLHHALTLPLTLCSHGNLAKPDITSLQNADVLIVDDISSLTPPMIDIIQEAVKLTRENGHYIRVVFSGDLLSMPFFMKPPDVKAYTAACGLDPIGRPITELPSWKAFLFNAITLTGSPCRSSEKFTLGLSEMRLGDYGGYRRIRPLLARAPIADAVWVCQSRIAAEDKNRECLDRFPGELFQARASMSGGTIPKDLTVPETLRLKEGMPVILAASIPSKNLVNGETGTLQKIDLAKGRLHVSIRGRMGRPIILERYEWKDEETGSSFMQYPILPFFAATAARMQNMELESLNIQGTLNADAALYSILSRARDPSRVHLEQEPRQIRYSVRMARWYGANVFPFEAPGPPEPMSATIPIQRGDRLGYRFGTYTFRFTHNGKDLERTFVCLRNVHDGTIVITRFGEFVKPARQMRAIESDIGDRAYWPKLFLDYAFIDGPRVASFKEVTIDIIRDFFQAYGTGRYGRKGPHTKQTFGLCVSEVLRFLEKIHDADPAKVGYSMSEIYVEKVNWSPKRQCCSKKELGFELIYDTEDNVTIRDIPTEVVAAFLRKAYLEDTDILMNVALSLFGGLRPSETCSLETTSIKDMKAGTLHAITIDLSEEKRLRSDKKRAAKIKRKRTVTIEPMFVEPFRLCWERHMAIRRTQAPESGYDPLILNSRGKAMTYEVYRKRFYEVMDKVGKEFSDTDNEKVRKFFEDLHRYNSGPHGFRHKFTCILLLAGYSAERIMVARGDNSIESALDYIKNKGEILSKCAEAASEYVQTLMELAGLTIVEKA